MQKWQETYLGEKKTVLFFPLLNFGKYAVLFVFRVQFPLIRTFQYNPVSALAGPSLLHGSSHLGAHASLTVCEQDFPEVLYGPTLPFSCLHPQTFTLLVLPLPFVLHVIRSKSYRNLFIHPDALVSIKWGRSPNLSGIVRKQLNSSAISDAINYWQDGTETAQLV
jgi:hypothetical protein